MEMEPVTPRGHKDWCAKLWRRLDRDHSRSVTIEELDSEEFRSVLRQMLVPQRGSGNMGGASYERSRVAWEQALHFCMHKADHNHDKSISFEEFEAFMLHMRQDHTPKQTADLVFALFDLDLDGKLDKAEFQEVYRFYLGRSPTHKEVEAEWGSLDRLATCTITRQEYVSWLTTSNHLTFMRQSPRKAVHTRSGMLMLSSVHEEVDAEAHLRATRARTQRLARLEGRHAQTRRVRDAVPVKPVWLQRFSKMANVNDEVPAPLRNYFVKQHSLPELKRYAATHRDCKELQRRLAEPRKVYKAPVMPVDTPDLDPMRGKPGWQVDPKWHILNRTTGSSSCWEDHWQTARSSKPWRRPKGSPPDMIGPMGNPPAWMFIGEGEDKES